MFIECDRRRRDHDFLGDSETVRLTEELSRKVMYNKLPYIGTCGGAKVAGKYDPEKTLYDNTDSQDYSKVLFIWYETWGMLCHQGVRHSHALLNDHKWYRSGHSHRRGPQPRHARLRFREKLCLHQQPRGMEGLVPRS